jgi:hypothetical protein
MPTTKLLKEGQLLAFAMAQIAVLMLSLETTPSACAAESQAIRFEVIHGQGFRSHCGGVHYVSDVLPWLGYCEQRIRSPGFDEKLFKGTTIGIRIDINDQIGRLTIVESSGSSTIDRAALDLIQAASPFAAPEIGLPLDRPLMLECKYPKLELRFLPSTHVGRPPSAWWVDPYSPPRPPRLCAPNS